MNPGPEPQFGFAAKWFTILIWFDCSLKNISVVPSFFFSLIQYIFMNAGCNKEPNRVRSDFVAWY
jgi:hypothetical protein